MINKKRKNNDNVFVIVFSNKKETCLGMSFYFSSVYISTCIKVEINDPDVYIDGVYVGWIRDGIFLMDRSRKALIQLEKCWIEGIIFKVYESIPKAERSATQESFLNRMDSWAYPR